MVWVEWTSNASQTGPRVSGFVSCTAASKTCSRYRRRIASRLDVDVVFRDWYAATDRVLSKKFFAKSLPIFPGCFLWCRQYATFVWMEEMYVKCQSVFILNNQWNNYFYLLTHCMNRLYITGTGTAIEVIISFMKATVKCYLLPFIEIDVKERGKFSWENTSTKNQTSRFFLFLKPIFIPLFFCYDKLSPYLYVIENWTYYSYAG